MGGYENIRGASEHAWSLVEKDRFLGEALQFPPQPLQDCFISLSVAAANNSQSSETCMASTETLEFIHTASFPEPRELQQTLSRLLSFSWLLPSEHAFTQADGLA